MTSGAANELPNPRQQDSPEKAAAKAFAFVLTLGASGMLLVAGHPRGVGLMSALLALSSGVKEYRYRRGLKYSIWPAILAAAVVFLMLLLLVRFKVLPE